MVKLTLDEAVQKFQADRAGELLRVQENILFCNANNISVKIKGVQVTLFDITGTTDEKVVNLSIEEMKQAAELSRFVNDMPEEPKQLPMPPPELPPLPDKPLAPLPRTDANNNWIKRMLAQMRGPEKR